MEAKEGIEVQITFDKLWEVAKSTWHVALLFAGLIWGVASYKTGLDTHLNFIDNQLKLEDNKLNWLIDHHSDKQAMPLDQQQQYVPQSQKVVPQSLRRRPAALEAQTQNDISLIPPLR